MSIEFDALAATDPEIADIIRRETMRQNTTDPAHRVGELHVARGARGAGFGAHQQVLRGLPGQALLRRQPRGRRSRGARARPALRAVRCRARQRAAALGRQRQHGRVPRPARAGRQGHGHAPRPGWPPHPRFAGELQRSHLRLRVVRRRPRVGAHRPRRAARPRARRAAQADHRRGDGLPAHHRLRRVPRDRRRLRRAAHGRRRAHRRASSPVARTRRRSRSPTSSPPPRTRRCAARVPARSCAASSTPPPSTRRCSPGCRAVR